MIPKIGREVTQCFLGRQGMRRMIAQNLLKVKTKLTGHRKEESDCLVLCMVSETVYTATNFYALHQRVCYVEGRETFSFLRNGLWDEAVNTAALWQNLGKNKKQLSTF